MLLLLFACADPKCTEARAIDDDLDGYGVLAPGSCEPAGGIATPDCDDADASAFPGAPETCNGRDDDCDGVVDEDAEDPVTFYADLDADGFGDEESPILGCSAPAGAVGDPRDCDDADPEVNPSAEERCGGADEDCDGETDEDDAIDIVEWYRDADGDGYGGVSRTRCEAPEGYDLLVGGDCDDGDPTVYPGGEDLPGDRVDGDCDGIYTCYTDADGDGYSGEGTVVSADGDCRDAGEDDEVTDCDDTSVAVSPAATEVPYDSVDQDCDGADLDDVDADGWIAVEAGGDDCLDTDDSVNPAGTERCDSADIDDDCDGLVDGDDPDVSGSGTWYADADGDGAGDPSTAVTSACPPAGYVADASDCDDTDATVRPLAAETCADTIDRNCDGYTGTDDHDGDGYAACEECDDGDASERPGATEALDGDDDDCDGLQDEQVGDLVIASEADALAFCGSYASVEGDLDLRSLGSLRSLGCLRAVSGDMRVSGVTATNLLGLEALTDVGGSLLLGGWQDESGLLDPSAFTSLTGLERLARVGGDFWVAESEVADLSGAPRLAEVGGGITLLDLPLTEAHLPLTTLGNGLWLETLPNLAAVSAPSLTTFDGGLWIEASGARDVGFTVDWPVAIPGTLALVMLPAGANAGWVLPDTVGGLYIGYSDLADLAGLETLRWIDGDVLLQSNTALVDLSALDGIEEVSGDFAVGNGAAADWDGFPSLTYVGGTMRLFGDGPTAASGFGALEDIGVGLTIESNDDLVAVTGFERLAACPTLAISSLTSLTDASGLAATPFSGEVTVEGTRALTDLHFLAGVTSLEGSLFLSNNRALTSLAGLERLTRVGGALDIDSHSVLVDVSAPALTEIGGALSLTNLPALTRLDLGALATVGGDVSLDRLLDLAELDLGALREVGGLWVYRTDTLVDLSGLDALTTVHGSIVLEDNDGLTTLAGLGALESVGVDLRVDRNAALLDLAGLDRLSTVGQDLTLSGNARLVRPDALGALTAIGRDLWVENNASLVDLSGMGSFTVGNTVYFATNDALTTLDGLDALTDIPHHLVLYNLPALESIGALANVERIGADVRVSVCDSLPDLTGLDAVTEIGESLEIGYQGSWGYGDGNASMVSLDGLASLRTIGDDLYVMENDVLQDIDALDALESVGRNLYITNNVFLPTADAEELNDGTPTVGGTVRISGNL